MSSELDVASESKWSHAGVVVSPVAAGSRYEELFGVDVTKSVTQQ